MNILGVKGREVLDSRGNPTVEAEVRTKLGVFRAMVPSGASAGSHEALELRDMGHRFLGEGVQHAVRNVDGELARTVKGMDVGDQHAIDSRMIDKDGTSDKSRLGANAILAVSMAACKAGAAAKKKSVFDHIGKLYGGKAHVMPVPLSNVINGGKHAGQAHDVQEHMIIPIGAKHLKEAVEIESEIYHVLGNMIKGKFGPAGGLVADEGGYAPPKLRGMENRFDLILKAADEVGYTKKIALGIDVAANEIKVGDYYVLGRKKYSAQSLLKYYSNLVEEYPLISIEDPFTEDDWEHWRLMEKFMGKKVQIVGDDLFVTNTERIIKGIALDAANAVLVKVNQIGTVTEALDACDVARQKKWNIIVSHRSGETEDNFIADLAVGVNAGQCKFGAPAHSDRNAKYNQLLRIEEELGRKAKYDGNLL